MYREKRICKKHGEVEHFKRPDSSTFRCVKCASNSVILSRRRIKSKLVEMFGGKCHICGYSRCAEALDFHHKDEKTKSFGISKIGCRKSYDEVKKEALKCILLCANCHRELHAKIITLPK